MTPVRKSVEKLRKLKQIRRKNLEKNFLEIQMKGQDHYVFIKENGKAQVAYAVVKELRKRKPINPIAKFFRTR